MIYRRPSRMSRFALNLSQIRESNNINLLCGFEPFRLSRAPSSLYLVVESLCLSRSRARSYSTEVAVAAEPLRFIDLSPSTFTLPSHMPHPTLGFSSVSHFSPHAAQRRRQIRKDAEKVERLLPIERLSSEARWSRCQRGTKSSG